MEQRTDEWHAARLGKVTASMIHAVTMKPTTAGYANYRAQLVCERLTGIPTETFVSAAMQHGTDTEDQARAFYELSTGVSVKTVGFVAHQALEAGCSPDGLVGGDGLVEIKCPQPAQHIATLTGQPPAAHYREQMLWQMECTGRRWCDFVSFCPSLPDAMRMHVTRVDDAPDERDRLREAAAAFLADVDRMVADLRGRYG